MLRITAAAVRRHPSAGLPWHFLRSQFARGFIARTGNVDVDALLEKGVNATCRDELESVYDCLKKKTSEITSSQLKEVDKTAVFANNEMSLKYIDVYGFDYDYTIASYSDEIHSIVYNRAVSNLLQMFGYPRSIEDMPPNFDFPIRGLHFDTTKGLLMKLDSYSHLQLGSVYRGLQPMKDWDVIKSYGGTHLNVDQISRGSKKSGETIHQQIDLFSLSFMCLLSNVIECFVTRGIPYDPEYIYRDCEVATQEAHYSGYLHKTIMANIGTCLPKAPGCEEYLSRLKAKGKKLFMITNSGFKFVDCGMRYLIGDNWRQLFDVVIVQSRKPSFFGYTQRPFRKIDLRSGLPTFEQVASFEKHGVYCEGNIGLFAKYTKWDGPNVLYFGDHVYSDLMDPVLRYGWRTGAVIPELEREIEISNSLEYQRGVEWLLVLENLMSVVQVHDEPEIGALLQQWRTERKQLRLWLKRIFNPQFGSVFRTYHNPTYFCRRMTRYSDVYTSALPNLLDYSTTFTFYPRRNALPHEFP